jgi:membrane-bound ClpP family serine protease
VRKCGREIDTREQESAMLNGVPGMVGETAVVTRELAASHKPGTVLARGEEWFARPMFPGTVIAAGTTVVVADVERGVLICYPVGEG